MYFTFCQFSQVDILKSDNMVPKSGYVRSLTNGTNGNFTIGIIGCHWYHWQFKNSEQILAFDTVLEVIS